MTKINLNVLFKKMQKDDKKDVMEFHIVGESVPHFTEMKNMMKNMVVLNIEEQGDFPAEFTKLQVDTKKTVLLFKPKGDNDELLSQLFPIAGSNVSLTMEPSQMDIEDFEEQHEGVKVQLDKDGMASVVDADQMSLEDVPEDSEEDEDELE